MSDLMTRLDMLRVRAAELARLDAERSAENDVEAILRAAARYFEFLKGEAEPDLPSEAPTPVLDEPTPDPEIAPALAEPPIYQAPPPPDTTTPAYEPPLSHQSLTGTEDGTEDGPEAAKLDPNAEVWHPAEVQPPAPTEP